MKKELEVVPTLTFEPFVEETNKQEVVEPFDESTLTEEEQKMVEEFTNKIELNNSNVILQYGAGAQQKIADFSESTLNNIRSKDLGEVGELLSTVVFELKKFGEEEKGVRGFFQKKSNAITSMMVKYEKAEVNINKICQVLEGHQIQLLKDSAMLDKMYDLNKTYFKELSMYILAGKKKLQRVQIEELPTLVERAELSNLPEDAQSVNDLTSLCNRFEKKIHDLELTRMVSIQMAPQIRLVQSNDTLMSEKIQSTLVNTIPLWKSQMVLTLGMNHSKQAAEAQREVTNMTNELLRKNAQALKMATIETAKESERSIVDIDTLKETNEALITTLDEVVKIQEEGRQKRKEAEEELYRIEGALKERLLQMRA